MKRSLVPGVPTLGLSSALLTLSLCGIARADDAPTPTPYRPNVTLPAALSAPGYLEIEAGGLQIGDMAGGAKRSSLPYAVKLAFSEDWGIRLTGEAYARLSADGQASLSGGGDTSVVLKRRFEVDKGSAFGLELGLNGNTAKTGLGADSSSATLNGIYSIDVAEGWHVDSNLNITHFRNTSDGLSSDMWGASAALSRTLSEKWGVLFEVSGTRRSGTDSTAQGLVAASYTVSSHLILDFGGARSLRSGPSNWTVFGGLTWLGPKLF